MPEHEKNLDLDPGLTKTCPVTGLPVLIKPEWINVDRGGSYRVSCALIGKNIIMGRSSGYVKLPGLKKQLELTDELISTIIPPDSQYVWIEDYSNLKGVSRDARNYYINYMKSRKRLKGLIYFNVSPMFALTIKLAKRLYVLKFNVTIVDNYAEAVRLAVKMLVEGDALPEVWPGDLAVTSSPNWSISIDDFTLMYEIIGDDIIHGRTVGFAEEKHFAPSFELAGKIIRAVKGPEEGFSYHVYGLTESLGIQRMARRAYIKSLIEFYGRYQFQMAIFYGASRILKGAIYAARLFVPFKVRVAKDLEEALEIIAEIKSRRGEEASVPEAGRRLDAPTYSQDQIQRYIEELLGFLGSLDWKTDGVDGIEEIDTSHPFSQVFDALAFLKADLDNLFEERERAEKEKEQLLDQLARARKMEAIGTLAGGVAHDLNNILSGIVSYPELLLMQLPQDSPLRKSILTIQKSGEKAAAVVQDLLTLAGRGVMVEEPVNLNDIIIDYLKSSEFENLKFAHPELRLETNLDPDLLSISGSQIHLFNMIMNLVSNGAEAVSDGGKVAISTAGQYIEKPIKGYDHVARGEYAVVEVSDDGAGLAPEDLERIFEPFFTKKVMGRSGTGLGMAVVWGTVKDHRGYIDVNSGQGAGTTFSVYLPADQGRKAIGPARLPAEDYLGRHESVLVVDDVAEQREIAVLILEELGYSVETVSSGEAAVEYLRHKPVDILVLDMIMEPGIDGLETYRRIIDIHPGQKAIIASGFSETDRVREAQALGAGPYIKKPYTLEKIGMAIRRELDEQR